MNQNNLNPSEPEYWDFAYLNNNIAWDIGKKNPVIDNWLKSLDKQYSICVLGAGNGWDAINCAKYGHDVTAIDFSEIAIKNTKNNCDQFNVELNLLKLNLFDIGQKYNLKFDIVLEYTCFCAINPKDRNNYIEVVYRILKEKGKFIALFFPTDKKDDLDGPPFGVDINNTIIQFSKYFNLLKTEIPINSIKPRFNREQFTIFSKND